MMIVEFTGCSGAGKSAVLNKTYAIIKNEGYDVITPLELFLPSRLAASLRDNPLENILLQVLTFPWFLMNWKSHTPLLRYSFKKLRNNGNSFIRCCLLMRSIIRKIGINECIRQWQVKDRIVLVDEGMIHIVHVIFANGPRLTSVANISDLLALIPQPDFVVYVSASLDNLLRRTALRSDKPVPFRNAEHMHNWLIYVDRVFSDFFANGFSENRLIRLSNNGDLDSAIEKQAKSLFAHLKRRTF